MPTKKKSESDSVVTSSSTSTEAAASSGAQGATAAREYSFEELTRRAGEATDEEVLVLVSGAARADLVADGRHVATSRVNTDCLRLYLQALRFFDLATAEQLERLTITRDVVRLAVHAATRGYELSEARRTGQRMGDRARAVDEARASGLRAEALAYRSRMDRILDILAGEDPMLQVRAEQAFGRSDTPDELGTSLQSQGALLGALLADPSAALATRRKLANIPANAVATCARLAAQVREVLTAAEAPLPLSEVSQGDVDYWDGINLRVLDKVVCAFDGAHKEDPSVPRLLPIALRGWFGRSRPRAEPASPPADAGTTPA